MVKLFKRLNTHALICSNVCTLIVKLFRRLNTHALSCSNVCTLMTKPYRYLQTHVAFFQISANSD